MLLMTNRLATPSSSYYKSTAQSSRHRKKQPQLTLQKIKIYFCVLDQQHVTILILLTPQRLRRIDVRRADRIQTHRNNRNQ